MTTHVGGEAPLKIYIGDEFKIKVEAPVEFPQSPFLNIYNRAAIAVSEIRSDTHAAWEGRSKYLLYPEEKSDFNNVIAFVGERGSGKSSVMLSFASFLNRSNLHPKNGLGPQLHEIGKYNYHVLRPVDPTLFEDGESILRNIIASMFARFKDEYKKEDKKNIRFEDKTKLIGAFQEVYDAFRMLIIDDTALFATHKNSESSLETLAGLAHGVRTRDRFNSLVTEYLHFMLDTKGPEKARDNFLVIPIDDLDMNMKNAYQVAEDVRKYITVPNVIILMAVKIDQLRDMIIQEFDNSYAQHLNRGKKPSSPTEDMADRYLEKLIPVPRRLFLRGIHEDKDRPLFFGMREDDVK